jgi:hypothetical protein
MGIRKAHLMAYFGHRLEVAAFQMAPGRFQLDLPLVLFGVMPVIALIFCCTRRVDMCN